MANQKARNQYIATIGIECHVQLKTKTKLFSAVSNDATAASPNTLISHICLGMPGALPVLNEEAVRLATKAAFALKVRPQLYSKFDRKHYFYPDLPKGYQISQFDQPIILGGKLDIMVDGEQKTINITRAHLEEDAGKSTHPEGKDYSLVDLNRAGTPLLEIVSEPEMHSPQEAKAYAKELYLHMRYADVSEANLYHGNMRFDVNVSVSKDSSVLGTRSETKNLNSFKSVEKAVEYEINRQVEVLEKGGTIIQETRGWDESKQKTISQRTKEEAHDYRYFPDPDLPPIVLDEKTISDIENSMPILPGEWRERLKTLGLDDSQTETLLDAELDNENVSILPLVDQNLNNPDLARHLVNWFVNSMIPLLRENKFNLGNDQHLKLEIEIYNLLRDKKLNSTNAKVLFTELATAGTVPDNIEEYAAKKGYIQVSDEGEIAGIVEQILSENPQAAEDVKNGEMKAIGFLVGQVMKASRGKANPQLAQKLIKEKLGS